MRRIHDDDPVARAQDSSLRVVERQKYVATRNPEDELGEVAGAATNLFRAHTTLVDVEPTTELQQVLDDLDR